MIYEYLEVSAYVPIYLACGHRGWKHYKYIKLFIIVNLVPPGNFGKLLPHILLRSNTLVSNEHYFKLQIVLFICLHLHWPFAALSMAGIAGVVVSRKGARAQGQRPRRGRRGRAEFELCV